MIWWERVRAGGGSTNKRKGSNGFVSSNSSYCPDYYSKYDSAMTLTTPANKASEHKSWHVFRRGGCLYCGWHCDDCPNDVATCKCTFTKEERADEILKLENSGITDSWLE